MHVKHFEDLEIWKEARDQKYISTRELEELLNSLKRLSSMIGSLINYLKGSGMKGAKYNRSALRRL
jgi:hypothetical protein